MTRIAPSRHSKRGPLRSTPVSVFFPDGPVIVHCEVDAVFADSPFRAPQASDVVAGPPALWALAGPARSTVSRSTLCFLIVLIRTRFRSSCHLRSTHKSGCTQGHGRETPHTGCPVLRRPAGVRPVELSRLRHLLGRALPAFHRRGDGEASRREVRAVAGHGRDREAAGAEGLHRP